MAARTTRAQSLTPVEVAKLGDQLAGGGRPRVQLSGPQFPAGSTGTVIRVGDPTLDGSDYITVRVKLNGVSDELAFAPGELSLRRKPARDTGPAAPRRGGRSAPLATDAAAARPTDEPVPSAETEPVLTRPPATSGPDDAAATDGTAAARTGRPKVGQPKTASPRAAATRAGRSDKAEAGQPARGTAGAAAGPAAASAGGRRRKPTSPPKVSFSITSTGASWAVSATRGPKGIVKNIPVLPGAVTAIADLLEQPALIEAVADINETAWAEAQARADELRAELDRLEAVLAAHRSPG